MPGEKIDGREINRILERQVGKAPSPPETHADDPRNKKAPELNRG